MRRPCTRRADRWSRPPRVARALRTRGRYALFRARETTRGSRSSPNGNDRQPIQVREADVAQGRRNASRHVELRRLGHRSADVEHQVDREVALFIEEPKQQPVQPLIGLPVDVAVVITGGVRTMVGEFKTASALRRQPVGAVLPGQRALGDDVQVLELLEEVVFEAEGHPYPEFTVTLHSVLKRSTGERRKESSVLLFSCLLYTATAVDSSAQIPSPSRCWQSIR